MSISISDLRAEDFSGIAGRQWQQNGLRSYHEHLSAPSDFAVYACPGAGKTRFAIAAAKSALDAGVFDCVVVVAPQRTVIARWRADFAELAGINVLQPAGATALQGEIANNPHSNFALTYSSLGRSSGETSTAEQLAELCRISRVLVILDEVHHMAEERTWGEAAREAFSSACRLHLSGTPFRSDQGVIPWLMVGAVRPDAYNSIKANAKTWAFEQSALISQGQPKCQSKVGSFTPASLVVAPLS